MRVYMRMRRGGAVYIKGPMCGKFTTDVSDIIFSRREERPNKTGRINLANKFPLVKNKL